MESPTGLLRRYRDDRRKLLEFLLSSGLIKQISTPAEIEFDHLSADYVLECIHSGIYTYTYIVIYIHVCVCVCVCFGCIEMYKFELRHARQVSCWCFCARILCFFVLWAGARSSEITICFYFFYFGAKRCAVLIFESLDDWTAHLRIWLWRSRYLVLGWLCVFGHVLFILLAYLFRFPLFCLISNHIGGLLLIW